MISRMPAHMQAVVAALIMIVGMSFIPLGDAFAKLAAETTSYSPATIAWSRLFLGMCVALPLAWGLGYFKGMGLRFWRAQLLRGFCMASAIVCIVTSVGLIPLFDAFGAFFVGPAIATILARFVLKEHVHRWEWCALAAGFVGVMFIVKPGFDFSNGHVWALTAGFFYGGYLTATRWAAPVGPTLAQLAGQLVVGTALLSPLAVPEFASQELQAPLYLLGSGASSAAGNFLAIMAFGFARAGALTPLVYTQLLFATLYSYAIFDEAPDTMGYTGLTIILLSGLSLLFVKRNRT